jgi:hypothetical protein
MKVYKSWCISLEAIMGATLTKVDGDTITLEITVNLSGSMLDSDESILGALNDAGCIATGEALSRFDTDGSRIEIGDTKWFTTTHANPGDRT